MIARSFAIFILFLMTVSASMAASLPSDGVVDIWPSIPFVRGADLCRYRDAYSQTRTQYMEQMARLASEFYYVGVGALVHFNDLYDRNLNLASQNNYLDVTLESTFKAYMDGYYRNLHPKTKKISFTNTNDILSAIRSAVNRQPPVIEQETLDKIDYMAYGTYTLAPSCQGEIQITLHMLGKNGATESYVAIGRPEVVMSQIASEIFAQFQRTQFPSEIRVGSKVLKLIGALNSSVDKVANLRIAEESCQTLDARLPTQMELELLDSYGDWSGGVSIGERVWALSNGKVYAPNLRNPTPVRNEDEVRAEKIYYYCVR